MIRIRITSYMRPEDWDCIDEFMTDDNDLFTPEHDAIDDLVCGMADERPELNFEG